jgi:hypothetical protein
MLWSLEKDGSSLNVLILAYEDIFGDDWVFVIGEETNNEKANTTTISKRSRPNICVKCARA